MRYIIVLLLINGFSTAFAEDSTSLATQRRNAMRGTGFYCPIGREPMMSSVEGLNITPNAQCKFSSPIGTVLDPLILEPPVLNPLLQVADLKSFLAAQGVSITNDSGNSFRFQVNSGPVLTVAKMNYKSLKDNLMQLHVYPPAWGEDFTVISAQNHADFATFVDLGRAHPESSIFWTNPHYNQELQVRSRVNNQSNYLPIDLVSKCGLLQNLPPPNAKMSLLLVGDLHNPPESAFFNSLLAVRHFSWVGLEIGQEQQPLWDQFVQATDSATEDKILTSLFVSFPANIRDNFKNIMRSLKAQKIKTVFVNSYDIYFNLPFTDVSFFGLIVAARNLLWANSLPSSWSGEAAILGGLDHFTNYPGSDFQNFATERFSGLPMTLVNPLEVCP